MIKLCIFDMGGVLIRNHNVIPALTDYLGFPGVRSFHDFGNDITAALKSYSKGITEEKDFWKVFSSVTGHDASIENGSLFGGFFSPVIDKPTEDVIKALKANGMRVVCGTNVIKEHYEKHIALSQYAVFDKVYPSYLMHLAKPDEEFYLHIAEEEGVSPSECFFTDDLQGNIDSAAAVGMRACLYTDADNLIRSLHEEGIKC